MPSERMHKILREVVVLGLLVVGILAARSTLADHYYVPSGSMEETLQEGDRVFVDKRAYGFRVPFTTIDLFGGDDVARGDVVIFDSPHDGIRLIKRIVAIGGDEVVLENGHLSIDGVPLAASEDVSIEVFDGKQVQLNLRDGGGRNYVATIPDGMVLAIGDHRGASKDGRFFGPVPASSIYGRAIAVYYRSGEGFSWLDL